MTYSKSSLIIFASAAILLSGCTTSRFENNNVDNYPPAAIPRAPMSGSVEQSDLPPTGDYPNMPNNSALSNGAQSQVAIATAPANASDLTPASVAGVWTATVGGMKCRIATPQTKYGQGYRAGVLQCPAAFSNVNSWAVSGKQLNFYDSAGNAVASLYSSNPSRFEGRTTSGLPVVLSR